MICFSDGHHLKKLGEFEGLGGNLNHFDTARTKLVDSLVASIGNRYKDFSDRSSVVGATQIADFKTWPPVLDSEGKG